MKLDCMKTERDREVFKALRIGLIHKNANDSYEGGQFFDDLRGARRVDVAWTRLAEIKADCRCAQQGRISRILEFRDPADFDARHNKPRMAAAGSGEVKRCSPMRKASAPA